MLLSFKVKNFKSFAEEAEFSMIAVNRQTGLDYSIYQKRLMGKTLKDYVLLLYTVQTQLVNQILLAQWMSCEK